MAQSEQTRQMVRIGGASGFWGDSALAARQLIEGGNLDYLTFDYLAEVTMSILTRMRRKSDDAGYARDFVAMLAPHLPEIARRGIRVVANAGGVNLDACVAALQAACAEQGVSLTVGSVQGDDLMGQADAVRASAPVEMETGAPLPDRLTSMNAYLGAFPIARALAMGADIVVTGRCVDSALILGPLIHEFGWRADDFDLLAQGSLAGHLLECGAQVTGGNFTDWREVADDWSDMGWPIAGVARDGTFVITKPEGTGGLVSRLTVAEQLLYEIGDPATYRLPDVTCDFSAVRLTEIASDRVRVTGARGRSPSGRYKISATHADGWKIAAMMGLVGREAVDKARAQAAALRVRAERIFAERGLGPFSAWDVDIIGSEGMFGDAADPALRSLREVVLRVVARHPEAQALELFGREYTGTALAMATGRLGMAGGRPKPAPVLRLFSFLYPKDAVTVTVRVGEAEEQVAPMDFGPEAPPRQAEPVAVADPARADMLVPLWRLAVARSGDKGDNANIGVIARRPEYLPWLRASLTETRVALVFAHLAEGPVERFDAPGLDGMNFLLHRALGGGGVASTRLDTQAKAYAQILLETAIPVPPDLPGLTD